MTPGMASGKPLSVFVVDDDPMIVEFVTTVLQGAGHEVRSDLVGLTAISEIAACRPDVVLTDLMMAAVDGLALCRELRRKPRLNRTAIIFMTSRTEMVWRDQAAAAGADGYIEKPLDLDTFVPTIERIVETGRNPK